jgi:AraC-like DNA-binding protein
MMGIRRFATAENTLPLHRNPGVELCYVLEGEFEWLVEGQSISIRAGEASLTRPWEEHGGPHGVMKRGVLAWVIIGMESANAPILQVGSWSRLSNHVGSSLMEALATMPSARLGPLPQLGPLFLELYCELMAGRVGHILRIHALLDEMLVLSGRRCLEGQAETDPVKDRLGQVLVAMQERPEQSWQVHQMAEDLGMGIGSFIQQVKQRSGLTPKNFLMTARIGLARQLLETTDRSVTEIAMTTGFASSQHFATLFRRYTGQTPMQWRQTGQPGQVH